MKTLPAILALSLLGPSAGLVAGVLSTPLGPAPVRLRAPTRVAVDEAGRLYVTDYAAGRVVQLAADLTPLADKNGLAAPLGIAVDAAGRTYVGESGIGQVTIFDADWQNVGALGAGPGEFALPGHLAIHESAGQVTVFVSDSAADRVKVYEAGLLVREIGAPGNGDGEFDFPAGLWIGPAGELYVADQNNARVQVFDLQGQFQRAFDIGGNGFSGRVQGLCGDAQGRILVADTFQGFVRVFNADGGFLGTVGDYGAGPGMLLSPGGVAVDATGRLAVASINTGRLELYRLDAGPRLAVQPSTQDALELTWESALFTLESAPSVQGPWTPVPGASPHVLTPGAEQPTAFFRLRRQP